MAVRIGLKALSIEEDLITELLSNSDGFAFGKASNAVAERGSSGKGGD